MAIQFARARYIGRSTGGNAVRSAAYNAREALTAAQTGTLYYFRHRGDLEHHEMLLPEGADPALGDSAALWNTAEAAEKRCDAQVARELVIALPADAVVTHEDRVALARSFAIEHFVSKGLAVQLNVHAPHADPGEALAEGEGANWHVHLLVTTRRVEGAGLAVRKARDLEPQLRQIGGRQVVTDGEAWGELWRVHQDRWFVEHGLGVRVDATAAIPGVHLGPERFRIEGGEAAARAEALRQANEAAARDPEQVLAALTRNNATFTERELERYLGKHLPEGERAGAAAAVLAHPELLALHERATGAAVGRFTTRTVREQERVALADAAGVLQGWHGRGVGSTVQGIVLAGRTLRADQRAAFEHATGSSGLAVIEGRAGTGKSYTLGAVREAYEVAGYRVVGLAPTNAVAQDLGKDGFGEAGTVHSALFALKNGRTAWDRRTVVVVDEAAMLDSRITGELLASARAVGATVVLAGDDRQLASIERGGLFTALRQRHGSAVIRRVDRQQVAWQRQAAEDLAEGRFEQAVKAFDAHGAVTWTAHAAAAQGALVAQVKADVAADPQATRFVFAYTNAEVDTLNAELREVWRERGALVGADVRLETKHGAAGFAVGDRVQFTDTAKKLGIYNGNAGTITGLDAATSVVTAQLDSGREVAWQAGEFIGFRHGYAGTIYKGQGRTLDHTYLLHSQHWRAAASYVALTRQRHSAQVFVSRETAGDAGALARQMARGEVRAASVAWATAEEVAPVPEPVPALTAEEAQAVRDLVMAWVDVEHGRQAEMPEAEQAQWEQELLRAWFVVEGALGQGTAGRVLAALREAPRLALEVDQPEGVRAMLAAAGAMPGLAVGEAADRRAAEPAEAMRRQEAEQQAAARQVELEGIREAAARTRAAEQQAAARQAELPGMRARLLEAEMEAWWRREKPYVAVWERPRWTVEEAASARAGMEREIARLPEAELRQRDAGRAEREQAAQEARATARARPKPRPGM